MTDRRALLAIALAAVLIPGGVMAGETPYLTAKQLDLAAFLPLPPPAGSVQDRAEMAEVLALQAARSLERAAQAKADSEETVWIMFGPVLGPAFAADKLPRTALFFARIGESEDATVDPVKKVFARPRPFQVSPEVQPAAVISRSGSYPSGHATRVTVMGIVLAEMLPEKRALIWPRVDDYAESRVIGGVHYRSDIEAGKRAGTAMAATMLQTPEFRADYAAARAELRAALGL